MPDEKLLKQFIAEKSPSDEDNTAVATISNDIVDRDGEIMLPKGCKLDNFLKNPVVMFAHDRTGLPVGSAKKYWVKRGKKYITAKWEWAPTDEAQEVRLLWDKGFLNATSVGFIPLKSHAPEPDEIKKHPEWAHARRVYDEWELLEFSIVPVPANPDALALAVKNKEINLSDGIIKDLGLETDEEEIFTSDVEKMVNESFFKAEDYIEKSEVLKPYPNEHACRLKSPDDFDKFARKNCEQKHEGKCIDVIYGIKAGKSTIQALRYPKKSWTAAEAGAHCRGRKGTFEAAKHYEPAIKASPIIIARPVIATPVINVTEIIEDTILKRKGVVYKQVKS